MKRVVLSTLVIALLTGCHVNVKTPKSTSISKAQLVGEWVCSTKFSEWNTESINLLEIRFLYMKQQEKETGRLRKIV